MDEEIDDNWVNDYKESEKGYELFYKRKQIIVKIFLLFVKNNEVEHVEINEVKINKDNRVEKEEIMNLIGDANRYAKEHRQRGYFLDGVFKYNLTMDHNDVKNFINNNLEMKYLEEIKDLENIVIDPTIILLEDLNSIFVILKEREGVKILTKKLKLKYNNTKSRKNIT